MSFIFDDLQPYKKSAAAIKRPHEVAAFSFDDTRACYPFSLESLRYYYPPFFRAPNTPPPVVRCDLSQGFEQFTKYDDSINLHLNGILQTLEEYEKRNNAKVDADFVTWRGMMTKILTAPFDGDDGFAMVATRFQDTIFIEEDTVAKDQDRRPINDPERMALMQYWGYKFEALSTLPRPWSECTRDEIENRPEEVVNNAAQYCSIVRTGIGGHTLILGGEVDAVEGAKPDDPDAQIPYVELKTHRDFPAKDARGVEIFEKKLCRIWAQSFLLGVPKIVVGFRDQRGGLVRIQDLQTMKIPSHVKNNGGGSWDGNVCINFAAAFLSFLRQEVSGQGTWHIHRQRGKAEITVTKTSTDYPDGILLPSFKAQREQPTA